MPVTKDGLIKGELNVIPSLLRTKTSCARGCILTLILVATASVAHAEDDATASLLERVRKARKSAQEDAPNAKTHLAQAVEAMTKLAQQYKAQADALYPPFQVAYRKYIEWVERNDPDREGRPVPPEILKPLQNAFAAWLPADQKWFSTRVEQIDCYPEGDTNRKKFGEEVVKDCDIRLAEPAFSEQPIAALWYQYAQGRSYVLIANYEKAEEILSEVCLFESRDMHALAVKKLSTRERVRMNMKQKKYGEVLKLVLELPADSFGDDVGKEIATDYMLALSKYDGASQDEYRDAIRVLHVLIARETVAGVKSAWGQEFSRGLAGLVAAAREKGRLPKMTGTEWCDTASGFMLQADGERLHAEELERTDKDQARQFAQRAGADYQNAADGFRRAITTVRQDEKNPAERLAIEPKSWFALGACYLRMKDYSESIVAYRAFTTDFAEKKRTWLPDPGKSDGKLFYAQQPVKDSLAELETLLKKSGECAEYVYRTAVRNNPGMYIPPPTDIPGVSSEVAYVSAKNDMDLARAISDAAKTQQNPTNLEQAASTYLRAADKFLALPASSPSYELALFNAAKSVTSAHELYAGGKLPGKPDDLKARSKDLATRALGIFQRYQEQVAKTKAASDSDAQQRQIIQGQLLLFSCELDAALADWAKVLTSCDAWTEWKTQNPVGDGLDFVLRSKFRALIELASIRNATDRDERLSNAWSTMALWRQSNSKDDGVYRYMLDTLSRRYDAAAAEARLRNEENSKLQSYYAKIADLEELRFAATKEATVGEFSYRVFALDRAGRKQDTFEAAKALLEKFDPKATGVKIPDEPQPWQNLLAKMIGSARAGLTGMIRYSDLAKWERCRADHMLLIDYMYDTPQAAAYPQNDSRRPEFDRYNADLERAQAQTQTIRRNYPDCQTLKPEFGENGRSLITIIEDEIDFRQKIAQVRKLVCTLACEFSEQYSREGKTAEAQACVALANEQIKFQREHGNDSTELKMRNARMEIALGHYEEALTILYAMRGEIADTDSMLYFEVMKQISCVYAKQKKWQQAVTYPKFIASIIGFESKRVKENWPDMKAFVEECESHLK
jgi:hypothetical protein